MPPIKSSSLPADIQSAAAYAEHAQQQLDAARWRYLAAGSGEELTLADNPCSFSRKLLWPRPLGNVKAGNTRLKLFGQALDHPLLLAPIAYQRLFHAAGEQGSVAAADALGGLAIVSSLASQSLPDITQGSERHHWFQLYWQGDRERSLVLVRRALSAGYAAIVFTVDAPIKHATFVLPPDISAVNLIEQEGAPTLAAGQSMVFDGWMAQAPNWDDVVWLRAQIDVPLIIKGVLHPADAQRAVALGCDGLIVSNHGGRVLDGVPASIDVLPAVLAAVNGAVPVLLDSGIRSGADAFKALALGATAVLIGRPYIWGLATAGAMGVAHVIRLLRDELEMTMALTGCAGLSDISPACLYSAPH